MPNFNSLLQLRKHTGCIMFYNGHPPEIDRPGITTLSSLHAWQFIKLHSTSRTAPFILDFSHMWSCGFWKALWLQTRRRTSWQHNRAHTKVAHCCYSLHTSWEPNNCKWHSMYKRKVLTTILDESFLIVPSFMPKSLLRTLHHPLASCKWVGKLRKSSLISLMFLILISRQIFFF